MICKNCGLQQPDHNSSCIQCGFSFNLQQSNQPNWSCMRCGISNVSNINFCTNCGLSKMESRQNMTHQNTSPASSAFVSFNHVQQPTYAPPNSFQQPTFQQPGFTQPVYSPPPVKRKKKMGKVVFVFACLGIAFLLKGQLIDVFQPKSKPMDSKTEIAENANEFIHVEMNQKAIDLSPAEGISVHVPENVMEKDRQIKVAEIDEGLLKDIAKQIPDEEFLLVDAFEFDMGLQGKERIMGAVEIQYDLDVLKIPKALQEYIRIVRLHEGEPMEVLIPKLEGNLLTVETQKNSIEGMIVIIPATIYLGHKINEEYESNSPINKIKQVSSVYKNEEFRYTKAYTDYKIYWPASMAEQNPTEVARVNQGIQELRKKYELDDRNAYIDQKVSNGYRGDILSLLDMLAKDPDYIKFASEINSFEWQSKNWWPTEVVDIYKRLKIVDTYLFTTRDFHKPKNVMEIYLLPYAYMDDGEVINPVFDHPYMFLNIKGINDLNITEARSRNLTSSIEAYEKNLEILTVVMTHEIFHMSEISYVAYDYNGYVWLWEALATLLEKECYEDYVADGAIKASGRNDFEYLTKDNQTEWFAFPIADYYKWPVSVQDPEFLTRQGYASSPLLMALKTQYLGDSDRTYIGKIMKNLRIKSLSSTQSNGLISVVEESSKTEQDFNAFMAIYFKNNEKTYFNRIYTSKQSNPKVKSLMKQEIRLSEPISQMDLNEVHYAALYKEVTAAYNDALLGTGDYKIALVPPKEKLVNFSVGYKESASIDFKPLDKNVILEKQERKPFYLQEIHCYGLNEKLDLQKNGYYVLMLLKPKAPEIETEEGKLTLKLPQKSEAVKKEFIKKYRVKLWNSYQQAVEFDIDANETKMEVSLDSLGKFGEISEKSNKPIKTMPNLTKEYLDNNPTEKQKLITQYGADAVNKMIQDNLAGTLDMDSMMRAVEVLQGSGQKWYSATVTEMLDIDQGLLGPEGEICKLEVNDIKQVQTDLVGIWKGKDELTKMPITITISKGTNGFDYDLENSLYGNEILFSGYLQSPGVYRFVMAEMEGRKVFDNIEDAKSNTTVGQAYTITVNSENELYMIGGPTGKLKRQ